MQEEIRHLINVLSREVVQSEGFARELAELANKFEADGNVAVGHGMVDLSRHQRIRGIKARAEIAALIDQHR